MPDKDEGQGWTFATLKTYLLAENKRHEQALTELDRRYEQRFAMSQAALAAALESAKQAIDKAEGTQARWNSTQNEWRGSLNDMSGRMMPRIEVESMLEAWRENRAENLKSIDDRFAKIDQKIAMAEGNRAGVSHTIAILLVVAALLIAAAGVVVGYAVQPPVHARIDRVISAIP